ncbi:MAG: glutamine-hydrolyzing carbamoyl-phosphate synthase small subunit [Myxococcota bacterium]
MSQNRNAALVLADGRVFWGRSIGAEGTTVGEVVFTTAMSGYQEVLSDPSFKDQIVTMTCVEIGNVGTNPEDMESDGIQAAGLLVRSSRPIASSWRSTESLQDHLQSAGVVALEDVDTRALVLHIRTTGAQMGVISTLPKVEAMAEAARSAPGMAGRDLAREAMCRSGFKWTEGPSPLQTVGQREQGLELGPIGGPPPPRVVALDFGMKRSMLRRLVEAGASVEVLPGSASAEDVLSLKPDGVFWSNGPGDPEPVSYGIETARKLRGRLPMLGICLGHQVLALAYGGKSFKMKFGHRGSNHPVQDEQGRVRITSQNHGFAIDPDALAKGGVARPTEFNLNDQTLEGFVAVEDQLMAVQYHPEASPGPHDATDHFRRFVRMCAETA